MAAPISPTIVVATAQPARWVEKATTNATKATARQAYPIRIPVAANRAMRARWRRTGSSSGTGVTTDVPRVPRTRLSPRGPPGVAHHGVETARQLVQRELREGELLVVVEQVVVGVGQE